MTTFADLIADVNSLTNRPDLVNETKLAVRAATLKAHHLDYFYKDLFESGITFFTSEYQQTLAYKDLIPRWRSFKYLRKSDIDEYQGPFLTLITPDSVLDNYSINREDVVYLAGLELKTRTACKTQYFLLGCYVHPDITEAGYNSWVADEYPLTIIYEAAAIIFKTIGFDEQVAAYRAMVRDEYSILSLNNIVANGY